MKKSLFFGALFVCVLAIGSFSLSAQASSSPVPLSGWAWSSNIGWISFSSGDSGAGGGAAYNVTVSTSTAGCSPTAACLSGYAWSSNIGWISFMPSDVGLTPSCGTPATINFNNGAVTGWVRAVSGIGGANGWDGCIELSGTNHATVGGTGYATTPTGSSTQGVAFGVDSANSNTYGLFSGFSWDSGVLGWLSFAPGFGSGGVTCPGCFAPVNPVNPPQSPNLGLQITDPHTGLVLTSISADVNGNIPAVNVSWVVENLPPNASVLTGKNPWTHVYDWPEGSVTENLSTGGRFMSDSNESVQFSDYGSKELVLSYEVGTTIKGTAVASITVNPYSSPTSPSACSAPANASMCTGSSLGAGTVQLYNYNKCPSTVQICQFQCSAGYAISGGRCTKSGEGEI